MAFFQELGKKIGEVAQDAQKKTSELIEINKLNTAIKDEKEAIAELHRKIGLTMYASYAAGDPVPDVVSPDVAAIADKLRNIMSLEAKIVELKSDEAKQAAESAQPAAAPDSGKTGESAATVGEPAADTSVKYCTGCGAPLTPGVAFCSQCGQKVG